MTADFSKDEEEPRIEIFKDRSVLYNGKGKTSEFYEGRPSIDAQLRYNEIKKAMSQGYLDGIIKECLTGKVYPIENTKIDTLLNELISSISSQFGRGLVGLFVLQLCVKAISPKQSIRLHKGGTGDFSWKEGISMRTLDANFIAPTLRKYDLLKYNQFGVMMSRSFAENYPYSKFYKASIRGPREQWLELVDLLEGDVVDAELLLRRVISLLINRSEKFKTLVETVNDKLGNFLKAKHSSKEIKALILTHVSSSNYPARLFEIAMHSLVYTVYIKTNPPWHLRPLAQMRSANKKFGNIGDIELLLAPNGQDEIIQAWDAKFGKSYMLEELGELTDKLGNHKNLQEVGFVVDGQPEIRTEIEDKLTEISDIYGVEVKLFSFESWLNYILSNNRVEFDEIAMDWLLSYISYICLKKPDVAPIEEPTEVWLEELIAILKKR